MPRPLHSWHMKLVQWLFPLPKNYEQDGPDYHETRSEFRYAIFIQTIIFFAIWITVTIGLYQLLNRFATSSSTQHNPAIFNFSPPGKWVLPVAVLCGLVIAAILQNLTDWIVYGSRYARYVRFMNLWNGFDSRKAMVASLIPLILICVMSLAFLNWQIAFCENDIVFPTWFGFSRDRKSYSSIDDICTAPKLRAPAGNIVERREYVIRFDDGNTLSTKNFFKEENAPRVKQAIEFTSMKSGKPIRELPILE